MKIELTLPHPISVNVAYAGMRVRFKSKKYKEWEHISYKATKDLNLNIMEGVPLNVEYTLYTPCYYKNGNHKKIDVANYEKVTSDFLSHIISGFEDSWIYTMRLEKVDSDKMEIGIKINTIDK